MHRHQAACTCLHLPSLLASLAATTFTFLIQLIRTSSSRGIDHTCMMPTRWVSSLSIGPARLLLACCLLALAARLRLLLACCLPAACLLLACCLQVGFPFDPVQECDWLQRFTQRASLETIPYVYSEPICANFTVRLWRCYMERCAATHQPNRN